MSDFWVFGYGSLMWRPGFPFVEAVDARLFGAHRALCILSYVHRGNRDEPGLGFGVDQGGSCRGVAFRVAPSDRDAVLAYLRERELVTNVYREVERPVRLALSGGDEVSAVTYAVVRSHEQYAGRLPREDVLAMVRRGKGLSGENRDYVLATAEKLEHLGIHDPLFAWLRRELAAGS
jgi:glutathione-specific gamma-glutamylcyclotransferase